MMPPIILDTTQFVAKISVISEILPFKDILI